MHKNSDDTSMFTSVPILDYINNVRLLTKQSPKWTSVHAALDPRLVCYSLNHKLTYTFCVHRFVNNVHVFCKYVQLCYIWIKFYDIHEQDVFVKHNAPDNGQFQRRPRSQGKYFDTSRKILSQEMTMCNMEALVSYL